MVQWKVVVFEPAARAFRRNTGLPTHNFRNLAPYQGHDVGSAKGDVPLIRYKEGTKPPNMGWQNACAAGKLACKLSIRGLKVDTQSFKGATCL